MALQNFVDDALPTIKAAWLNAVDILLNRLPTFSVSLKEFGAIEGGLVDASAALVLALATGKPIYDTGVYRISSTVTLPAGATIIAYGQGYGGSTGISHPEDKLEFLIDSGIVGFQGPETNAGYETLDWYMEGIIFSGGSTQVYLPNGGVGWTTHNCIFSGPTNYCIHTRGFNQNWNFYSPNLSGGQYGIYFPNVAGSLGATTLFDKSTFEDMDLGGQTINGVLIRTVLSNQITWKNLKLFGQVQDGMVLDGGLRQWTFINPSSESSGGYTGAAAVAPTTGSITSGTPTLVVASATGLAIGQTLTVEGAGASGDDLYSVIDNLVGTTATLHDNASTTVVSTEVVNYQYSTIKFTSTVGAASAIQFIGGNLGGGSGAASTRYAIDAEAAHILIVDLSLSRPIYDPDGHVNAFCGAGIVRCNLPITSDILDKTAFGVSNNRTQIPSPDGKNILLALRDSLGTALGTYGNIEVRRFDANRNRIFLLNGTDGSLANSGYMAPGGYGAGTGADATIGFSGVKIALGNAAPTAGTWYAGSIVFNQAPAVGQPKGWTCTVTGTPGTWVSHGNL